MNLEKAKELKQTCWNKLLEINSNTEIKSCPNCKSSNIKKMIEDYNYANYLSAVILMENGWKVKPNPSVKEIDLLGEDPVGNKVAVEIKTEFFPSDNFFMEFADKGKPKDYWVKALWEKEEGVYYGAICGKTKTLHLFDLIKFRETNTLNAVVSKYNTTGYLLNRTEPYEFKVGVYELGV